MTPLAAGEPARMSAATMTERVEFGKMPPRAELRAWQRWMRRHGIDPNDVPVGDGFVEVDGLVVRYCSIVRVAGRPVFDRERETFAVETRECQVYGRRPDPFPVPS